MKELNTNGSDLCVLMSALIWIRDCPFDKAEKPNVGISESEMNALDEKLLTNWIMIRDDLGVEKAREATIKLDVTEQELVCLHQCLCGILAECDGNPVELEVRAGMPDQVDRLEQQVREMLV